MNMKKSISYRIFLAFNAVFMILLAFCMAFPVYKVFILSVTTQGEYFRNPLVLWPQEFSWASYQYIFASSDIVLALWTTIKVTVIGTVLSLTFTLLMAYPLSKRYIPGTHFIHRCLLLCMFLSAGMMPTYVMVKNLGLLNSIWAMIIPGMVSLWNYLVIRSFFVGLPRELEEAALIDGASWLTTFTRIVLPISKPVIATFTLFYAVGYWNSWYSSMLYCSRDDSLQTLQLLLRRMVVENEQDWGMGQAANEELGYGRVYNDSVKMAACVVAMVPILVLYPFLQKHFVKGVTLGSVKG